MTDQLIEKQIASLTPEQLSQLDTFWDSVIADTVRIAESGHAISTRRLMDAFCKCVDSEIAPPDAILRYFSGCFRCYLRGEAVPRAFNLGSGKRGRSKAPWTDLRNDCVYENVTSLVESGISELYASELLSEFFEWPAPDGNAAQKLDPGNLRKIYRSEKERRAEN